MGRIELTQVIIRRVSQTRTEVLESPITVFPNHIGAIAKAEVPSKIAGKDGRAGTVEGVCIYVDGTPILATSTKDEIEKLMAEDSARLVKELHSAVVKKDDEN